MSKVLLVGSTNEQKLKLINKFKTIKFLSHEEEKKINCDAVITFNRKDANFFLNKLNTKNKYDWLHLSGAGIDDYIKFYSDKLKKFTIITNEKNIQGPQVADHCFALLLSLTRKIHYLVKCGLDAKFNARPIELMGKRCLIIGFGGIGKILAKRSYAFGMKTDIVSNTYHPISTDIENFYLFENLLIPLKKADIIFIACPSTKLTRNLFNKKILKKTKKGCYLINVTRGDIVNLNDLISLLQIQHFGGVALDSTNPEPLKKNHKIFNFQEVIITPHIAGISENLFKRNFNLIESNINRYEKKLTLINQINLHAEY